MDPKALRHAYSTADVEVPSTLEHIRRRPAMYIGETGARGLYFLLDELLEYVIEEARVGQCTRCDLELLADGGCLLSDNGRGLPVDRSGPDRRTVAERLLTGGGWVESEFLTRANRYANSLHGVSLSVVNALSERLRLETRRDGKLWRQEYRRSEPVGPFLPVEDTDQTGTAFTFWPDPSIFVAPEDRRFDFTRLADRLRDLSFLHPGLTLTLIDRRQESARNELFHHPAGMVEFVHYLNRNSHPVHPTIFSFTAEEDGDRVAVALQWTDAVEGHLSSYANSTFTSLGGTHTAGFQYALTRALNEFLREAGVFDEPIDPSVYRSGLTAVVAVDLQQPRFDSAIKRRLATLTAEGFVQRLMRRHLAEFLHSHPDDARAIAAHIQAEHQKWLAAKAAKRKPRRRS
jgi:DNA gyrase subunit B